MLSSRSCRISHSVGNSGMYVDLLVGSDTVRVYNMHLSSRREVTRMRAMCRTKPAVAALQSVGRRGKSRRTSRAGCGIGGEARRDCGRGLQHDGVLRGAAIRTHLPMPTVRREHCKALRGASYIGDLPFAHRSVWAVGGWTWWTTKRVASNYPTTARSAWHFSGGVAGASCRRRVSAGLQCLRCASR